MPDFKAWPELTIVYDIETFPNCFLLTWAFLHNIDETVTYEISFRKNDIGAILRFFAWCAQNSIEMVGFNNVGFDYPVLHFINQHREGVTVEAIYSKAMSIIEGERFASIIWPDQRFAPQIDLFLIHHFDNKAKTQSLKGLEFNMRSGNVQEMPVENGTMLTSADIDLALIPYNRHDVLETGRFALISSENVKFRREMRAQLDGDVLNFNDTKIGKQIFEQRLGPELCYTRGANGRKEPRQTWRAQINVGSIIFPYIKFQHPEFVRVYDWLKQQVITQTKGAFADVSAKINGFEFHFGTGGIHGSVASKVYRSDDQFTIWDVDVAALYPSIAIENGLYPEHLGPGFVDVYRGVREERGKHKKGTSQNAALKLANNGVYGDSGNQYSPMYDTQFTMSITINGQLLLCTLAEWLLYRVPDLEIIQINTDGVTFKVHRAFEKQVDAVLRDWEVWSKLKLEEARYSRMFIRDVNNYIAETEGSGKLKLKGAYWYAKKFPDDISNASPSAWYKDLSCPVVQKAAEANMIHGIPIDYFIKMHADPFDFCLRAKVDRRSQLFIGETKVQRIQRYYVAKQGAPLSKRSPPTGRMGTYKRKNGIDDATYDAVLSELRDKGTPDSWDARIHTSNQSTYGERTIGFAAGWNVADCNEMSKFDWANLNHDYYIEETRKLIIT